MTFNAASRLRSLEDRSAALGSSRCELPCMHSVPKSAVLPYASGVGGLSRRLLNKGIPSRPRYILYYTSTWTLRAKGDLPSLNRILGPRPTCLETDCIAGSLVCYYSKAPSIQRIPNVGLEVHKHRTYLVLFGALGLCCERNWKATPSHVNLFPLQHLDRRGHARVPSK